MKLPPIVEIWLNGSRRRFFLFKTTTLFFEKDRFVTETKNKNSKFIKFSIEKEGVLINSDINLDFIGIKKKKLFLNSPCFFSFLNYKFFIYNFSNYKKEFFTVGLNLEEDYVKKAFSYIRSEEPILIVGDTGSGKELLAKNIHYNSKRSHLPISFIDCSKMDFLNSYLFGSKKGSFTSALKSSKGAFLKNKGGTIVFDNIEFMPLSMQAYFLRFIEQKEIKKIGSDKVKKHKSRILVITSLDPKVLVSKGKLRQDLYYRLSCFSVFVPSLSRRKKYIPKIWSNFSEKSLNKDILQLLHQHSWPGNVREFKNFIERYSLYNLKILNKGIKNSSLFLSSDNNSLEDKEKIFLKQKLLENNFDLNKVSLLLDICKLTLISKIKKYNIMLK
jgi:transcriptional regulator with PAS, ATPase and Fis domain